MPEQIVTGLEGGKRLKVKVTINAFSYRSSVGSMGGRSMLPVSAQIRAGAGIIAGDDVEVDVELDTAPREVSVPEDVAGALAQAPAAKAVFEKLAYSHQLRWVTSVQDAKTPQTRQRRIDKMITALQEGSATTFRYLTQSLITVGKISFSAIHPGARHDRTGV